MGVAASGATLEIQLVADVARLQRDMKAMQDVVGSATSSASKSFAGMSQQTVNSAAQMAAAAQASARASVGMATGLHSVGASAANARIVTLELFHVTKNLTEQLATGVNPARALTSEIGRIATAVQYSGGSIGGLIKQFAAWAGIIKITRDAELEESAAQAAGAAAAIKSRAERAASTLLARNAEVALAQAALAAATSDDLKAAAQSRLVKAYRSIEVAAGQTAIANEALATANVEVAATAEAAAAAEVTALAPLAATIGIVAAVVAALGAIVVATIKYDEAQKHLLATSIGLGAAAGLTAKQLEAAGEAGASWSGASISQSTKAAEAFASSGVQSQEAIAQLSGSIETYADLTGVKFAEAQKMLAEAMKDPVKGASELHNQLGILDGDQIQQIERLSEMGEKNQAVAILIEAYTQRIGEANDAGIGAAGVWGTMTTALSNLWHWLGEANNSLLDHVALLGDMRRAAAGAAEQEQKLIQLQTKLNNMSKAGFDIFKTTPEGKAAAELDQLHGGMQKLQDALIADTALHGANSDAVKRDRQALDDYSHAINTYMTPVQKKLAADALDVKLAAAKHAHNQQLVKDLTTQKALLEEAGKIESAADARALAAGKGDVAGAGVFQPKPKGDHGLATALAELDAQIEGQNRLAAAYQVSNAAALQAEAQQKAEEAAIRHKGAVGVFVEKELALAIATRIAAGAKVVADLRYEADARAAVTNQVKDGLIPVAQMNAALELEMKTRELTDAAAVAGEEAKKAAEQGQTARAAAFLAQQKDAIDTVRNLTKAYADNNAEIARGEVLAATASGADQLDKLRAEAQLIGETNLVRATTIAQLEAEQFLRAHPGASPEDEQAYITRQVRIAEQTANNTVAQNNYNYSLSETANRMALIAEQTQTLGQILGDAFGQGGNAIGGVINALAALQAQEAKIAEEKQAQIAAGINATKAEAEAAQKSKNAQMQAIGATIAGLKSLFKEHSAGYKVMSAIEKAYAVFQAVQSALAIAREFTHTTTTVAQSAIRTTANTAEGGSKIFAELGPWAFPVVAAMVAVLAALGAKGGGGGGSKPPDIPTSGTGTVLGDSSAQSQSIGDALDLMAKNSTKGLDYSLDMVRSLRKIESGIGALAANVARQLSTSGGFFDTAGKVGTKSSGGLLGGVPVFGLIGSLLFGGSTTTKSLFDQGIKINPATIADILTNGISGLTYQVIEKVKKSSGFLGIGGGTKTSYQTSTGQLDTDFARQAQLVIGDIYTSVVDAAKVLGLDVGDALKGFKVDIGKISFKDLKGDEITKALEGVFSKVGDQMAGFAVSGLDQFQKAGEGLYETLMRLAKDYLTVDTALKSIGLTFGAVGSQSIAARESLIDLLGGLDKFTDQINFYYEHFLTSQEQLAFLQGEIDAQFAKLGIAEPQTIDQFKALVKSLDLTSDAGQAMFAALMQIAPAFFEVENAAQQAADELKKKTIQSLQQTIDQFSKFADSLKKYRDTLFASDQTQGNAYLALKAKFSETATLAATGNATALGGLEQSGKDFLAVAKNNAASLQDYYRDVALVARGVDKGIFAATETADYAQLQLDALQNATTILATIADNTALTAAALADSPANRLIAAPVPAKAGEAPRPTAMVDYSAFKAAVDELRADIADVNAGVAAVATNTSSADRTLKRWDTGDSVRISVDSDEPLNVNLTRWG